MGPGWCAKTLTRSVFSLSELVRSKRQSGAGTGALVQDRPYIQTAVEQAEALEAAQS